jgi:transposase
MADLLRPIYDGLKTELLTGRLIQSDDTPVPYQLDTLKKQTATGYLWTYLCESSRLVLYDFTGSHSRAGPSSFLSGFTGTLLTDGHSSYNEVVQRGNLVHAGCWAHARRKFFDARHDDRRRCGHMLKLIQALFAVERKASEAREAPDSEFGDVEHLALRRSESAPLLEEIRSCVDAWSVEVLPRSAVGQAVGYILNQWQPLTRFLDDPTLPLHNNASERAMRHVVIGRKNWMFAGSAEGGHRAAVIYSVVVTCRLHGLDPFVYLRDVIDRLPRGQDPATLLPATWKASQLDQATH